MKHKRAAKKAETCNVLGAKLHAHIHFLNPCEESTDRYTIVFPDGGIIRNAEYRLSMQREEHGPWTCWFYLPTENISFELTIPDLARVLKQVPEGLETHILGGPVVLVL
jgi:hypothetical protein